MELHKLNQESISDCFNFSDITRKFKFKANGKTTKIIRNYLESEGINTKHFRTSKYTKITKVCPVCSEEFSTLNNSKEKTTCSFSCANTHFRSGEDHPNYRETSTKYRNKVDISECNRCGYNSFTEILQVHHIDRNRRNNELLNLEVLCPNCHSIEHLK